MVDLGKYAMPVLLSYGATFLLLGGLLVSSIAQQRRVRAKIRAAEK